jgi:hypothetical protein
MSADNSDEMIFGDLRFRSELPDLVRKQHVTKLTYGIVNSRRV